jgi:hypothetical protein
MDSIDKRAGSHHWLLSRKVSPMFLLRTIWSEDHFRDDSFSAPCMRIIQIWLPGDRGGIESFDMTLPGARLRINPVGTKAGLRTFVNKPWHIVTKNLNLQQKRASYSWFEYVLSKLKLHLMSRERPTASLVFLDILGSMLSLTWRDLFSVVTYIRIKNINPSFSFHSRFRLSFRLCESDFLRSFHLWTVFPELHGDYQIITDHVRSWEIDSQGFLANLSSELRRNMAKET